MVIADSILSIFFPRCCNICGEVLVRGEDLICTKCIYQFPWSDPDMQQIGHTLEHFDNQNRPEKIFSLFNYTKGADSKKLIYAVKYRNKPFLAYKLGKILGDHIKDHIRGDFLIPVPLHRAKEKERGYNQSERIAAGISEITGIPVKENIIKRIKDTKTQTGKNASQRYTSMEDAFSLENSEAISNRHVILVDDVITTGATTAACIKTLAAAENVKFTIVCIARTSM